MTRQTFCDENNIPSLRSQSGDIAQYPEIANQSNCAILEGSRVAYTKSIYVNILTLQKTQDSAVQSSPRLCKATPSHFAYLLYVLALNVRIYCLSLVIILRYAASYPIYLCCIVHGAWVNLVIVSTLHVVL